MKQEAAFSLVEVMIVIAIASILAALALPAFIAYVRTAKTSEAIGSLRRIYEGELSYYLSAKITRVGAQVIPQFVDCPPTPPSPPTGQKEMGDWNQPEWSAIQFGEESPVNYSYSVDADGTGTNASFTARAEGDLDSDGLFSLFERTAAINTTTGEVEGGSALYSTREIE